MLDDWVLSPLQGAERRDILEILEDRSGTSATAVTSQFPPKRWHDYVTDPTLADAICDRLLHNAHRIVLPGPSRRGGEARQLAADAPRRSAPITIPDRRVHHGAIWLFTMAGMRICSNKKQQDGPLPDPP